MKVQILESPNQTQESMQANAASDRLLELTKLNPEFARLVASSPTTPPNLLRSLSQSPDILTRQKVTANPNTPIPILWQLGIEFPEQLLDNPNFAQLLATSNLVEQIPDRTLASLVKCEKAPLPLLERGLKQCESDPELLIALTINPQTSLTALTLMFYRTEDEAA